MESRIDGLDDAMRKLRRLKANADALAGTRSVPTSELFTTAFIRQHTNVRTFEALMQAGGVTGESMDDLEANPDWESVIRRNTDFGTWREMLQKAGEEYARRRMLSGL